MIQIKRGLKSDIDLLEDGRLYLATDENEVYIGKSGENIRVSNGRKEYVVYLSQTGSAAPQVLNTIKNDIGPIAWVRDSAGEYRGVLQSAFGSDNSQIFISLFHSPVTEASPGKKITADYYNESTILIRQKDPGGIGIDEFTYLRIKIELFV